MEYTATKNNSFSNSTVQRIAVSIKKVLNGKDDELKELNDKVDCLQRAVANLTKLVAEDRKLLS